ncbi:hypothetical protein QBG75_004782 [Salmonella enterica]|nr:hypothetical protein [Salmonella enterica]EKS2303605.1 hypothetical protein [Salmonella enterica]
MQQVVCFFAFCAVRVVILLLCYGVFSVSLRFLTREANRDFFPVSDTGADTLLSVFHAAVRFCAEERI